MSRGKISVLLAVAALAALSLGCVAPLPAPSLTATAESRPQPTAEVRSGGGGVQSLSAGPLRLSANDGDEDEADLVADGEVTATPVATATPRPQQAAATPQPVSQPANFAADTIAALNATRTQRGLPALAANGALSAAANAYAQYMAQANFFGHFGPDGSSPRSRIAAAGFGGLYKGEALSAGQDSPAAALQALLASPAHAAILLDGSAIAVGIGHYYAPSSTYKHYWVVITGNP
jgi:uncharacterized protein YkwD